MKIPKTASEISIEWLKRALQHEYPKCEPISIEIEPNFGGPSLLGRIVRVKLFYAAPDCGPSSIIVKFQVKKSEWEARMYELLSESEGFSVPRLFGAIENGTLLLEDVSPARPGSQIEGCTVEQAREVLTILSEIHSHFWEDPRVPSMEQERFASVINHNFKQCWEPFLQRYREMLGDTAADFEWMWQNAGKVAVHRLSEPATLFHGDVHVENLLFSDEETVRPLLIDWQLASRGLASNDVSFFLVKSLSVKERRENEKRLLREYFEKLPKKAQTTYGFDRFLLDYRAGVTRSMMSAVMLVGPRFVERPDRFELSDVLAERVIAAVRDLGPVSAFREIFNLSCGKVIS